MAFCMGCGGGPGGGLRAARPTEAYQKVRYGGRTESSAPTEGLQGARWGGSSGTPTPTHGYKEHGRRADVGIGPYGWVTRGAVERVVGDADPYERLQEVR